MKELFETWERLCVFNAKLPIDVTREKLKIESKIIPGYLEQIASKVSSDRDRMEIEIVFKPKKVYWVDPCNDKKMTNELGGCILNVHRENTHPKCDNCDSDSEGGDKQCSGVRLYHGKKKHPHIYNSEYCCERCDVCYKDFDTGSSFFLKGSLLGLLQNTWSFLGGINPGSVLNTMEDLEIGAKEVKSEPKKVVEKRAKKAS